MLNADSPWELASHTITHADLTTLDTAELHKELAGSRKELEDRFGVSVDNFCYPAGQYDYTVIAAVKAAGYRGATTEDPGLASADSPYTLNRIEIHLSDGLDGFVSKLKAAESASSASSTG
jgi:peptidoglycan/xylan/chitin deacetylase (PgdA/CDA1 family)